MTLPEFLLVDSDGFIHPAGHRIGLHDIVYYYNQGFSPEMLFGQFPTLALPLIHKTIAFYLENREAVDEYVSAQESVIAAQRAAATKGPDAAELRRRLEAAARAKAS